MSPAVVAVVNQKGGVGKTTTAVFTAAALARAGRRVLIVDLDPQSNSTSALGIGQEDIVFDTSDLLATHDPGGVAAAGVVLPGAAPEWAGVWIVPARLGLARLDDTTELAAEFRLQKALDTPWLAENFDTVILDCPPSLGRLTVNGLVAADWVLAVSEPSAMSIAGVVALLETVATVRTYFNARLTVAGIIVNKMPTTREGRTRYQELVDGVAVMPGNIEVWETETIPVRAAIAEAMGAQAPPHAIAGRPASEAAAIYDAIATRLARTIGLDTVTADLRLRLVEGAVQ